MILAELTSFFNRHRHPGWPPACSECVFRWCFGFYRHRSVIAEKKIISIPVDFGSDLRLCWPEKQAKTCMTCDTCRNNLILHPGWFPACSGGVFRGCCGFYIQAPFGHLKRNHTDPCRLRQRAKTLLAREKERVRGKDEKFVVFVVYFLKTGSALLHHLLVVPSPCTVTML